MLRLFIHTLGIFYLASVCPLKGVNRALDRLIRLGCFLAAQRRQVCPVPLNPPPAPAPPFLLISGKCVKRPLQERSSLITEISFLFPVIIPKYSSTNKLPSWLPKLFLTKLNASVFFSFFLLRSPRNLSKALVWVVVLGVYSSRARIERERDGAKGNTRCAFKTGNARGQLSCC